MKRKQLRIDQDIYTLRNYNCIIGSLKPHGRWYGQIVWAAKLKVKVAKHNPMNKSTIHKLELLMLSV